MSDVIEVPIDRHVDIAQILNAPDGTQIKIHVPKNTYLNIFDNSNIIIVSDYIETRKIHKLLDLGYVIDVSHNNILLLKKEPCIKYLYITDSIFCKYIYIVVENNETIIIGENAMSQWHGADSKISVFLLYVNNT
jgi:hypothetical protein